MKNLHDEIVKADITPEKIVKSFQNIVKILELEDKTAMTFEVEYEGDDYSASLDMNAVLIDDFGVDDSLWERIRETNLTSEFLLTLVKKLERYLKETDQTLYKVPLPIGLKPINKGCTFSLDLRVYRSE